MELYKSKTGEVRSKSHWEAHLDSFWSVFEEASSKLSNTLPSRPSDAWERYVKVVGLVKIV